MFRLIALDIDGTLVGHDLTISPRMKAAVTRALERDLAVTLATGRGATPTLTFAEPLGLTTPLVCLQGAQVYDPVARRSLHEARLEPALVPWITAEAAQRGWHLHFETPDMVYMPDETDSPQILLDLFRVTPMRRITDFIAEMPETPSKFLVSVHDPAERDVIVAELQEMVQAERLPLHIMTSHPVLIEGVPPGVSKASGLAWLTEYLGLSAADVLAIGDNDNDIPMLEWAGFSVAMAQGSAGARAAADWIAPSVEDDGAALAIERYVLG